MAKNNSSIEKKIELLTTPFWSSTHIAQFFNCGKQTALKIKRKALLENPDSICPFNNNLILANAVLKQFNTTREDELALLKY